MPLAEAYVLKISHRFALEASLLGQLTYIFFGHVPEPKPLPYNVPAARRGFNYSLNTKDYNLLHVENIA